MTMNDIKLIVFDLDGTLLNSSKRIPESTIKALQHLRNKGIKITVATGRPLYSTLCFVKQLELDTYFSVSDSSLVINHDGDVLMQSFIDPDLMNEVLERSRASGCRVVWATNKGMTDDFIISSDDYNDISMRDFIDIESKVYNLEIELLKIQDKFHPDDLTSYMVFILGLHDDIIRLDEELKTFKNRVTFLSHIGLSKVYHQELVKTHELIILRPLGADKSKGVRKIAENYGIDMSQVMFFGDWYNDIEALDAVGYPVLMQNAPQNLKNNGYHITGSNDDDGIIQALEHFNLI